MKRAFIILFAVAISARAGCPEVYNYDDPPCVPCQYVVTGEWIATATFSDNSTFRIHSTTYENCDLDTYTIVSRSYSCPNGPDDEQCLARQFYFTP